MCIICPNSTAQEAAANSHAPRSPARLLQTSIFLKTGHLLAVSLCIPRVPEKKLLLLTKECLFSAHGRLIKKNSSISYKNTCTEEKISCDYGTSAEHQNLCWRYLSRDSNWCLSTPDQAFIFSEEFSFTIKIINNPITKLAAEGRFPKLLIIKFCNCFLPINRK